MHIVLFACLLLNAVMLFRIASMYRQLARLTFTLTWLALNSMALRHCWKAQIITLMAVVSHEDVAGEE